MNGIKNDYSTVAILRCSLILVFGVKDCWRQTETINKFKLMAIKDHYKPLSRIKRFPLDE